MMAVFRFMALLCFFPLHSLLLYLC